MDTMQQNNVESQTAPDLSILCDSQILGRLDALPNLHDFEKLGLRAELRLQTRLKGVEEIIPPLLLILRDGAIAVLMGAAGSGLWEGLKNVILRLQSAEGGQPAVLEPALADTLASTVPSARSPGSATPKASRSIRIIVSTGPEPDESFVDISGVDAVDVPKLLSLILVARRARNSPVDEKRTGEGNL